MWLLGWVFAVDNLFAHVFYEYYDCDDYLMQRKEERNDILSAATPTYGNEWRSTRVLRDRDCLSVCIWIRDCYHGL